MRLLTIRTNNQVRESCWKAGAQFNTGKKCSEKVRSEEVVELERALLPARLRQATLDRTPS